MPPHASRDTALRLAGISVGWLVLFGIRLSQRGDPRLTLKLTLGALFFALAGLLIWAIQHAVRYRMPWLAEIFVLPFAAGGLMFAVAAVRDALAA